MRIRAGILAVLAAVQAGAVVSAADPGPNLVPNPGFETVGPNGLPAEWGVFFPRREISPEFAIDSTRSRSGSRSARITATGSVGTFGFWRVNVPGIAPEPASSSPSALTVPDRDFLSGTWYRTRGYFRTEGIEFPARHVRVRLTWLGERGDEILTEYAQKVYREGEWSVFESVSAAPRAARSLQLELVLQWAPAGTVWWDDLSVMPVAAPEPRRVKVAAVSFQPPSPSTPDQNRRYFAGKVAEAGRLGADILVLGEGITVVSTGLGYDEVAEPVPGPTSELLGKAARQAGIWVVAGIYEREGELIYNTALLIDRTGKVAGRYRKTHLPETEVTGGLTPGDDYPVFQTEFGRVGIQICYDHFFPEVARNLALNGAELILVPIWGDLRGMDYAWDITARARAIDNGVFVVASNYSNRRGLVISPDGRILADTAGREALVTADLELDARTFERWLSVTGYGDWRNLWRPERRPSPLGEAAAGEGP